MKGDDKCLSDQIRAASAAGICSASSDALMAERRCLSQVDSGNTQKQKAASYRDRRPMSGGISDRSQST